MINDRNWMKLVRWSREFRPGAKQLMALSPTVCFLVSANSASASGVNGLPPVVVHPVHTFTTSVPSKLPLSHSNGNQIGVGSQQSGGRSSNSSSNQGSNAGSKSGGSTAN